MYTSVLKKFNHNESNILSNLIRKKMTIVALSAGVEVFLNIVVLPVARERGSK